MIQNLISSFLKSLLNLKSLDLNSHQSPKFKPAHKKLKKSKTKIQKPKPKNLAFTLEFWKFFVVKFVVFIENVLAQSLHFLVKFDFKFHLFK